MKKLLNPKKRKEIFLKFSALLFVLLLAFLFSPIHSYVAQADSAEEEAYQEFSQNIEDLIGLLDTQELQNYLDSLSEWGGISLKEKLLAVITGDFSLDYSSLASALLDLIWEEVQSLFPSFAVILAVALLCGILNSAKSGFMHSTMSDIIGFVGYISVGAVTLSCLISVLSAGFTTITKMQTQMELVYPLLLTLMTASGGSVSVAVFRPAVAFLSGAICELFTSVVLPVSVVIVVLAFVGNLSEEVRTEKLGDFFKSLNKWLIGFVLGIFTLFLSVQGIASAQYDGVSLQAVKYLISGSVPLVGGFLSGSADLVLAGSALIKNAIGAFAVFLLAGTILKPLILFAVFQLFLRVSAAATEPVGGKIPALLSRLAGDTGYFIAGLLCVAFLYFLTLVLLVCSSGALF